MHLPLPLPLVPRFRRATRLAFVLLVPLLAAGCSTVRDYVPSFRSFGVYKLDINQGNYVTQDQVEKLKEGMTKPQVRAVLGIPLITSAFRDNRWDYVYEYRRQGVTTEHRKLTVWFDSDKLAKWEGDSMPPSAVEQNRSAAEKSLKPEPEESGVVRWLKGIFRRG